MISCIAFFFLWVWAGNKAESFAVGFMTGQIRLCL